MVAGRVLNTDSPSNAHPDGNLLAAVNRLPLSSVLRVLYSRAILVFTIDVARTVVCLRVPRAIITVKFLLISIAIVPSTAPTAFLFIPFPSRPTAHFVTPLLFYVSSLAAHM